MKLKQSLQYSQRLIITPQLKQAIKLLQLSRLELMEIINHELIDNPLLDEFEEVTNKLELDKIETKAEEIAYQNIYFLGPTFDKYKTTGLKMDFLEQDSSILNETESVFSRFEENQTKNQIIEDNDWENYLNKYSSAISREENSIFHKNYDFFPFSAEFCHSSSLKDHLIWQLRMANLNKQEITIGLFIIGNLTLDGYLVDKLDDLAIQAGVSYKIAEKVLHIIFQFEPLGVAARNLKECLLIQANELYPNYDLVHKIIMYHLENLEKHNYQIITKCLGISLSELANVIKIIRKLNPRPGQLLSKEETQYITPDIYIYKRNEEYNIIINEDGLPKLRINTFYKNKLVLEASPETKKYIKNKLKSAIWLIRAIYQRYQTIYKVTKSIINFQRDFLDKGIAYLKPLSLKDIAKEVDMHVSTISRVTTNKYIHTPQGIFELKYFFNPGINQVEGNPISSNLVKERIKAIIAAEDPTSPLSDQAIGDILFKENIYISRRTITKYKNNMGIISSSRRKKYLLL